MPVYDYDCGKCGAVVSRIRKWEEKGDSVTCECGAPMDPLFPLPHCLPDGMYSYAPNVGSEESFERKMGKININKERKKDGLRPGYER